MRVAPFKLLNEPEFVQIRSLAEQAVAKWREDWLAGQGETAVTAIPASELTVNAGDAWNAAALVRSADESRWVALSAGDGFHCAIATLMAKQAGQGDRPARQVTPLLRAAIEECLAALRDEMLERFVGGKQQSKDSISIGDASRRGSGAAEILLTVAGEPCALLLSSRLVQEMLGPPRRSIKSGLATRNESIQRQRLAVHVVGGGAELDIGSLCSISPGDVILLESGLDDPFTLTNPEGLPIGKGHLGAVEGRKALQLIS